MMVKHSSKETRVKLSYKGMMLTTKVAEAARMLRLEYGPESFVINNIVIFMRKK